MITVEKSQIKTQDQIKIESNNDAETGLVKNGHTKQVNGSANNKEKKGVFARLFNKKDNSKEEDKSKANDKPEIIEPNLIYSPTPSRQKYTRKSLRRLESISYKFSKVANLNAKCKQLISFKGHLLVASNIGLFQIVNNKSEFIIGDAYINSIYPSISYPNRLYVGTHTGLETVDFIDESVIVNHNYLPLESPVFSILENNNSLWLGSDTKAIFCIIEI